MKTLVIPRYSEYELLASICRESFYDFLKEFWPHAEEPVWNWHIEYLCSELQAVAERVFKGKPKEYDLVINIPPGTTKSTVCSIAFPAWCWTRMASTRVISASYAYSLAMDLSRKSRDIIKSDKYQKAFPKIQIREDQDSKGYFVNTRGGDRYAVGVNGSVMGMHGHFIIVDDPLDPQQAISEVELKAVNHWMTEVLPSRKVDKAVTPMILIMQRLHEDDPSGARLARRDRSPVKHICLPAEISDLVQPPLLKMMYQDGYLDPIRLPRSVLDEALSDLGEYGYAGQFEQNPSPRGGGMFVVTMLKYGPLPSMWKDLIRYWDKAATVGSKAAFTAGVQVGLDFDGRFWILDVVRGRWNSAEREKVISQTALRDGPQCRIGLEQEPGSGGKESAENTAARLKGYYVTIDKVGASEGNKIQRAYPFSSQVNAGNVFLQVGPWNKEFIAEMEKFPVGRYKDQIDAASGGVNRIVTEPIMVGGLG
jgi:predicted phage terminase large subunit-like protein